MGFPPKLRVPVLAAASALLFGREIANDFLWGHDGGNGAPFWGAARTSLRFGVLGQAKDYAALVPPSAADFNTHHPLLLHLHLVVAQRLLGPMEWVGRLVPFAYSVGTVLLLFHVARRLWSPSFALLAAALYVTTPLHLVFATMIDHEQGGIFWTLLACYAAVRALTLGRRRDLVLVAAAGTLALQFAWGSYFVLASAGATALLHFFTSRRGGAARDRAKRLTLVLLATGLVNAGAFFLLVYVTKGSLADMREAFEHRAAGSVADTGTFVDRAIDLYGPLLFGATVAGLSFLVGRARTGSRRVRDLVATSFFVGQVGLSLVFRNAGGLHSYWTYFGGVACALLSAEALVAAFRALRRRVRPRAAAIVAALVLLVHARFALAQQAWGLATGHAAYVPEMSDQFEEVQLAKWLHDRYGRDVEYALHRSLNARSEIFYYLDAPRVIVDRVPSKGACPRRACVFVADLRAEIDGVSLSEIAASAREHEAAIFGDHLIVIDRSAGPATPRAYRLEARPAGFVHRWFVNGRRPPSVWVASEGAEQALAALVRDTARPTFVAESTKDGIAAGEPCPRGLALIGLGVRRKDGALIGLQGICAGEGREERTRWIGPSSDGTAGDVRCADASAIRRIGIPSAADLGSFELGCGDGPRPSGYVLSCPAGQEAVSIHARRSERGPLVGIGLGCTAP